VLQDHSFGKQETVAKFKNLTEAISVNQLETQTAAQSKVDDMIYRIEVNSKLLPAKKIAQQLKLNFEQT
jgi:hypothetical protein